MWPFLYVEGSPYTIQRSNDTILYNTVFLLQLTLILHVIKCEEVGHVYSTIQYNTTKLQLCVAFLDNTNF